MPLRFLGRDAHQYELLRHASSAFAVKMLAAGLSFGLSVLLARLLGVADTGRYYFIFTIITIAALISRSGIDRTSLRLVAANKTTNNWPEILRVYKLSIFLVVTMGAIATVVLVAGSSLLGERIFRASEISSLLSIAAASVIPIALFNLHAELLKGLKQTATAIAVESAWFPAFTLIGVSLIAAGITVAGALAAMLIASILTLLIGVWHWHKLKEPADSAGTVRLDELVRASRPLFWVGIFQLLVAHSAVVFLGFFQDASEIGRFSVASRTAALTSFVLYAVNSIAAPKFAELYRSEKMDELQSTAVHSATLMTILASPLLLLFLFAASPLMRMFGAGFEQGAAVLSILAIGQFVNVVTGSVAYLLAMTAQSEILRNTLAFSAILHMVLCFCAIPYFGAIGAAAATSATMMIMNSLLAYFVWKRLGIVTLPLLGRALKKQRL